MPGMPDKTNASYWYPLRLLSLYRLFVAIALLALAPTEITLGLLGQHHSNIYTAAAVSYFVLALFWVATSRYLQMGFHLQLYFQFATDLVLITAMMHASGGLQSGLGILLVVSIAGSCILLRGGIIPYFLAALATLTLLGDAIYMELQSTGSSGSYPTTGAMGAAFFGVALLSNLLGRRLAESEALASEQQVALFNLGQLNELIVDQFNDGILVIDHHHRVLLINQMAQDMLNQHISDNALLHHLSEELASAYERWQQDKQHMPKRLQSPGSPFEIQPHFIELNPDSGIILITLTDTSEVAKEVQTQKLTSLGRLTASIAHEIRNPLSAINHAAQLLRESSDIHPEDERLTDIISQQSNRLNGMVENIMQLSRKNKATPEHISLDNWLGRFRLDFCAETGLSGRQFYLNIHLPNQHTEFDSSQLHQILWNLCTNSIKYGKNVNGDAIIHIDCARDSGGNLFLDIYDEGPGIPPDVAEHIFEPFYTTSSASSGLGLYLCHELCAFNHAQLTYHFRDENKGGYFRILLP